MNLQIAKSCVRLIKEIGRAPRDEKNKEEIASYLGDDPLQGAGYGLYGRFGRPASKLQDLQIAERLATIEEGTMKHMEYLMYRKNKNSFQLDTARWIALAFKLERTIKALDH